MPLPDGNYINTTPKTEAQLRATLFAIKKADDGLADDIALLDSRLDSVEADVSALEAINRYSATNDNASTIVIGNAVYASTNAHVDLARADALATSRVVGLVAASSIASAATGLVQVAGILAATTGEWDVVTGQTGGLTPDAIYYLDPSTAGHLTTNAPTTDGQIVCAVGVAVSTTRLKIDIQPTILL